MWRVVACASLGVQASLTTPVCNTTAGGAGRSAEGECLTHSPMMIQANAKMSRKAPDQVPSWWAPPDRVAEDDRRYRKFVSTLLQDRLGCEKKADFHINASAVDAQHLKLFALANEVREMLRRRTEKQGFEDGLLLTGKQMRPLMTLLVWLRQYTVVHFDAEEKTMHEVGYMDMEAHKALHRAFYGHVMMWSEIVDVMMELDGSFHVGSLYVMVAKWLQDHVCVTDKLVGEVAERSAQKDAVNGHTTGHAVDDEMPDCVPAFVDRKRKHCVEDVSFLQGRPQPTKPAPEWWAPAETIAAHDAWYRSFVTAELTSNVVCELATPFDIAVKTVDAQHHKLLQLIDTLRALLLARVVHLGFDHGLKLTGEELRPMSVVLTWLKQYGVVHFDNEEQVMEKLGYPDAEHHKALHRAFYGYMMMASEAVDNIMSKGGGFHVGPIFVFAEKWLRDHVCTLDKSVGKFVEGSGATLEEPEDVVPDIASTLPGEL